MKCILEIKHVRPYYRNGDRETETVIIFHSLFKTKKSIKEFIKKDLINNEKEYVNEFLDYLSDSIDWANKNTDKAGQYASEIGVTTDANVISKSLARANLKYIPIKDMIDDYNNYYQKLFDFNAKTVGGKVPDEGIYFKAE